MRRPREHGWLTPDGITHHIDTRRVSVYHPRTRTATCDVPLGDARRTHVERVDCMTCIVKAAQRPRLKPRPAPGPHTPSWWTKGGDRHVRSANDPWRAVCGASLRAAQGSGNPPNCVACGGKPGRSEDRSWRDLDGVRHEMRLDDPKLERHAPCGADLLEARVARREPNCPGCRAAITETQRAQKGKSRGRLPQRR